MKLKDILKNKYQIKGAIIGTLLGDSTISIDGQLRCTHCPKQKDYLEFKKNIFEFLPNIKCKIIHTKTTLKKTNKTYDQFLVYSNCTKWLKKYRKRIYPNDKKTIDISILNSLTDFGLFLWFLDDGYLNIRFNKEKNKIKEYRSFFYTQCFSLNEVVLIKSWMNKKYGIEPNINKKENGYILYLNSKKTRLLMNIIDKYFHLVPCMDYKKLSYHMM